MKHERRFRGHYVLVKDGRKVQEERHWAGYKLIDELVAHRWVKVHRRARSLTDFICNIPLKICQLQW